VLGGNRWDDPAGEFGTMYCSTSAEGAFAETIARYRTQPGLLERIDRFLTGQPDSDYDFLLTPGRMPDEYFTNRVLGHISVDPAARFVDVDHPHTHAAATVALEPLLAAHGLESVDRGLMYHPDRRLTRPVARYYWQLARSEDHRDWAGLRYMSRLGPEWECWAVWEPSPMLPSTEIVTTLLRDHPDLQAAAAKLDISV
jgi:RES domain